MAKKKAKLKRSERVVEELKEELQIKEPEQFSPEDKERIKLQCEKYKDAKMLGTINSFMAKYAVCYDNQWVFVIYNRDKNRLVDFVDITYLTTEEKATFELFKSRFEMMRRKQVNPQPIPITPVAAIHQNKPPMSDGTAVDETPSDESEEE